MKKVFSPDCPKCGYTNINFKYVLNPLPYDDSSEEYMRCVCNKCGYSWKVYPYSDGSFYKNTPL